jgi:uncharacterized membrane protein YgdD (TMEM256/DUF423 family)
MNALLVSGILGATAVMAGAMGAHALEPLIDPSSLNSYETAVKYQLYHTLALLIVFALHQLRALPHYKGIVWCFVLGTCLFSGSIYLLATRTLTGITQTGLLGPLTPIGGTLLITGWLLLMISGWKLGKAGSSK